MKLEDITLFLASVFLAGCITYVLHALDYLRRAIALLEG